MPQKGRLRASERALTTLEYFTAPSALLTSLGVACAKALLVVVRHYNIQMLAVTVCFV